MVVFDSFNSYIESCQTLKDRIAAIDAIIAVLMATALKSAGTENKQEYSLNDGQTIIKVIYKGTSQVVQAIKDFQSLRTMYANMCEGYGTRLVPKENFIGNGF